jgi:hypothetical protein
MPHNRKGEKAHPRLDQAFDDPVILLHQMIEILHWRSMCHGNYLYREVMNDS